MLKNLWFKGREVVTMHGKIKFDDQGISRDLTPEQEKDFENTKGYEVIDNDLKSKNKESKKEDKEQVKETKEENKEENKEEPKEDKLTKAELEEKTVAQLEGIAKEKGITLEGSVKKDKIKEILDKQ